MKDAFGRHINEGDIVVYASRQSSSQFMSVAKVIKAEDERIRVRTLAGTDYDWKNGNTKWNKDTKTYDVTPHEGHEAWLRASGNVVVSNGIDAMGIHDNVMDEQRKNIEKNAAWRAAKAAT